MIEAVLESGEPNASKRNCYDCKHCKAAVTWWCTNKEAIKLRGTLIPGTQNCKFWEPSRKLSEMSFWERIHRDIILIKPQS